MSLIIANLLPCEESNTVVVDPAKLYGCETTGNIYWNSEMGGCRSCEYAVLRDNCVVDPAKLQGRETTVISVLSTLRNCRVVRRLRSRPCEIVRP